MDGPLDELYLRWLYGQVASIRAKNPARTYWSLIQQLYIKEFIWFVPNDDNRVEDGRDLRHEFMSQHPEAPLDESWLDLGCSFLEMLIGLSRRLAFETEGEPRDWFWHMMENLDLRRYNDLYYKTDLQAEDIDDILDTVINRTYQSDGRGGLFPLEEAEQDQRDVEIWYQSASYVLERGLV